MSPEELLDAARRTGLIVTVEGPVLCVAGRGPRPRGLLDELLSHRRELLALLRCSLCGVNEPWPVRAYWGDSYCKACCAVVARQMDDTDSWPSVEIPDSLP